MMDIEIYNVFRKVGISDDDARAVVDSLNKTIDQRYTLHAAQLATKLDLSEAKFEIIKWSLGSMCAAVALFASITKIWQ